MYADGYIEDADKDKAKAKGQEERFWIDLWIAKHKVGGDVESSMEMGAGQHHNTVNTEQRRSCDHIQVSYQMSMHLGKIRHHLGKAG